MPVSGNKGWEYGSCHCDSYNTRSINPGKTCDKAVDLRFACCRVFYGIQNTSDHGFFQSFFHADLKLSGGVDATRSDLITFIYSNRYRFSCDRRSVDTAVSLNYDTIKRDAVSGTDQKNVSDLSLFRGNYLDIIACDQVYNFRTKVYGIHDLPAASFNGFFLKKLADAVEEHNAYGLSRIIDGKSGKCCNAHEKVFVKNLSVRDVFGSFYNDNTPKRQVCDHKYRKSGTGTKAFVFHDLSGNEEYCTDDNADDIYVFPGEKFLLGSGLVSRCCWGLSLWLRILFFYKNFGFNGCTDLTDLLQVSIRILCS